MPREGGRGTKTHGRKQIQSIYCNQFSFYNHHNNLSLLEALSFFKDDAS